MSPQTIDSLFQGKPLSRESFPGNHFSRELFHKASSQSVIVPTRIFSKTSPFSVGLCFSKNSFQRNCFTGTMSWNGPCLQRNCFSKNFFQRNSFSRNCFTKSGHVREWFQITVPNNLFDVSELALYL